MSVELIDKGWGYHNGAIGRGRALHVAGQIGVGGGATLEAQFGAALDAVLRIVRLAGGAPEQIAEMTVYVTDIAAYRAATRALGEVWKARLGRHYPAMALVAVAALVDPNAVVEIHAVAYLEDA
jgi:enamine deaminase RidA (YjgF/YER057c/UK114 family)